MARDNAQFAIATPLRAVLFFAAVMSLFLMYQSMQISDIWTTHLGLEDYQEAVRRGFQQFGAKATIGYAVTFTECKMGEKSYLDGAAVLSYSIHKHSIRSPSSSSRYDYKLYAFLHPNATSCSDELLNMGYNVQIREIPFDLKDIRGPLKEYIHGASCCGATEFLKLYAYTLVEHPIVVHLDTDMMQLQPFDDLFDSMLDGPTSPARERLPLMWKDTPLPDTIDAFFTRDYNMMIPKIRKTHESAVQGGFLVIRPSLDLYEQYREVVLEGDYEPGTGWGHSKGMRFGGFYGAPQIQGITTYFFGHIMPNTTVELNRCRINSMADNPTFVTKGDKFGLCLTGHNKTDCVDCRDTNITDIMSIHFTVCQKPWYCPWITAEPGGSLCKNFHDQWYQYRHELEMSWAERSGSLNTTATRLGLEWAPGKGRKIFCGRADGGGGAYTPIQYPEKL